VEKNVEKPGFSPRMIGIRTRWRAGFRGESQNDGLFSVLIAFRIVNKP
jgi:hypothetical protein